MQKYNIAVLMGGPSAEREVSLKTGKAVADAIRQLGHTVHEIDAIPGKWRLPPGIDVAFLALHGTYGEDGAIQEELENLGIPYTGCDPASSRIAFDKVLTKQRCAASGVPTAPFRVITSQSASWPEGFPLPAVLKPVCQGSSVGLEFINSVDEWPAARDRSFKFDNRLVLEEKIEGRETTVGILDSKALPIVEVRPKRGAYSYDNKYTTGATEYFCPADFPSAVTQKIQQAGLGAFNAVGGRDYGRIDIMVNQKNEPVVLEVNTLPGMTETSLLPKAAAAAGISYNDLCQRMIELALKRARARANKT
jgi:D-alanine-D-alanine ligase